MSEVMRPGFVSIEGDPFRPLFACWLDGRDWNGWAVPYLTRDAVDALRAVLADETGSANRLEWSPTAPEVLLEGYADGGPVEWRTVERVTAPDGSSAWAVGDGWVWSEVSAPCALCVWSDAHGMHYCESEYGQECGHACAGEECRWAPSGAGALSRALEAAAAACRAAGVDPARLQVDMDGVGFDFRRASLVALERAARWSSMLLAGGSFVVMLDGQSVGFAFLEGAGSNLDGWAVEL